MNTKLIVASVIVRILAIAVVGLVSAQIVSPTPTTNAASNGAPAGGFFGWMGRCWGFRSTQCFGSTVTPSYQAPLPANITVTDPNTGQTATYQGYAGYGGCMRGFYP